MPPGALPAPLDAQGTLVSDVAHVKRTARAVAYEWTQATVESPTTLGGIPIYSSFAGTAKILQCPGPAVDGCTLERVEFAGYIGENAVGEPFPIADPVSFIGRSAYVLGECYALGSTAAPDPDVSATVRAVISAQMPVTAVATRGASTDNGLIVMSTMGWVTSKGVRGPADYGGGQAQVNFGLWLANEYNTNWYGAVDTACSFAARCLWRLP